MQNPSKMEKIVFEDRLCGLSEKHLEKIRIRFQFLSRILF